MKEVKRLVKPVESASITPPIEDIIKKEIDLALEEIRKEIQQGKIIDVLNSILNKLERIETNTFKGF